MRRRIYIYGAGGFGREVLATVRLLTEWEPAGFIDDNVREGSLVKGLPVFASIEHVPDLKDASLVIGVGDPIARARIALALPDNIDCPVIRHPTAQVIDESSVNIGAGSILCAGAILTTDIGLGHHVLVNLNSTIGHDSTIGSYSSVMPSVNISGGVCVGEAVLLGSGSNLRNGVVIGNRARIGMGAVVLTNVKEGETVVGVPARPL